MLRSIYITCIYLAFLALGISAPFVFSLGYVWVDTFVPQGIATVFLPDIPVSLIMAIAAIAGYFLFDRRFAPSLNATTLLTLTFAVWVTLSTFFWSVSPDLAYTKWVTAIKVLLFSVFIPLVFRSRIQIEAFLLIYIFSLLVNFLPVGLKTAISGGGYGKELGVLAGNTGLAEGSTLSAVSLMIVPIILYLRKHTQLIPRTRIASIGFFTLAAVAVIAAIGTYERTALVGLFVVAVGIWVRSRHKFVGAIVGIIIAASILGLTAQSWINRISTTVDYQQEGSALGRLLVWKWTLDFVQDHPEGGGFNSYVINRIVFPAQAGQDAPTIFYGKAFHSIYFEVLGEQGWFGLFLFLAVSICSLWNLQISAKYARRIAGLEWCRDLAYSLQIALLCLLGCGTFIGIAFQPMLYYLFAMATCIRQYVRRVEKDTPVVYRDLQHVVSAVSDGP